MSSEPSPPNSPGQLPLTDAPNPINHFPLNWKCQKTERGVPELTLWEDVWAEPEAYPQHTCRCGIHREDSRGHKQGRNTICRQEDLVLVPRVHKGNSNDLAFHTPAPPLLPASSTKSSVRGSTLCHGGDSGESQHINIDIRWLLATPPVITQFVMPALTATFYWCTCVNTTQNESLTLGTCTNYLSHLVCQEGIGHIWQSYWVSAPGIWNHYSLYWIHSPSFVKNSISPIKACQP